MVGRKPPPPLPRLSAVAANPVLRVRGLRRIGDFADVDFELRHGEVLGIAGLMGAGRTELAWALFGLAPADRGEIWIHGRNVKIASPRDAIANGIALVSEDRQDLGIVARMSVMHNITLSSLRRYCRGDWIDRHQEKRIADDQMRALSIRASSQAQEAGYLSGGNQQKVILARAMLSDPEILILDEPTRGIDIGVKAEIHAIIRNLARAGKAVIVISSELPEILALSSRILVMQQGRIMAELDPGKTTEEEILRHAMPRSAQRRLDASNSHA
jgi:ABC-type sugar transport system ATPase subunit